MDYDFKFELESWIANKRAKNPDGSYDIIYSIERRLIDHDVDYIMGYSVLEWNLIDGDWVSAEEHFANSYDLEDFEIIPSPFKDTQ